MMKVIIEKIERPKSDIKSIGVLEESMTPLQAFGKFAEDKNITGVTISEFLNYFWDEKGKLREEAKKELGNPYGWILAQFILYTNQNLGPVPIYEFPVPKDQLNNTILRGEQKNEILKALVFEEGNNRIITDLTGISFNLNKDMLSFIHPEIRIRQHPESGFTEWIIINGEYDPIIAAKIKESGRYEINIETGLPDKDAESNLIIPVWVRNDGEWAGFPHGSRFGGGRVLFFNYSLACSSRVLKTNATVGSE